MTEHIDPTIALKCAYREFCEVTQALPDDRLLTKIDDWARAKLWPISSGGTGA